MAELEDCCCVVMGLPILARAKVLPQAKTPAPNKMRSVKYFFIGTPLYGFVNNY
jgi:hypothetical protein